VKAFEAPHQPNLTGTEGAYRPDGSLSRGGARPPATGDYQAWKPE
jgi:NADH:ubiquinone oxidoreductase subunit